MKQKAFLIIFKGISLKRIKQIILECESPTLNSLINRLEHENSIKLSQNKFHLLVSVYKNENNYCKNFLSKYFLVLLFSIWIFVETLSVVIS